MANTLGGSDEPMNYAKMKNSLKRLKEGNYKNLYIMPSFMYDKHDIENFVGKKCRASFLLDQESMR